MAYQTKYVRPGPDDDGGASSYGDESGDSYDNAYAGILPALGLVTPPFRLIICGVHLPKNSGSSILKFSIGGNIPSGVEGQPNIISGDYAPDLGVVWGAYLPTYDTWTDELDNTFSITLEGSHNNSFVFEDIGAADNEDYTRLTRVDDLATCRTTDGSYYAASYSGGGTFYVNPTGADASKVALNRYGYRFSANGLSHIIWHKLTIFDTDRLTSPNSAGPTNCQWRKCKLAFAASNMISFLGAATNNRIVRTEIHTAPNALYTLAAGASDRLNVSSNFVIDRCYLHDIGAAGAFGDQTPTDGHAVGIQGGSGHRITRTIMDNCLNAISIYASGWTGDLPNQALTNTTCRQNVVRNGHNDGAASSPRHYQWACDNQNTGDKSGHVVEYCIARGGAGDSFVGFQPHYEQVITLTGCIADSCWAGVEGSRSYTTEGFPNINMRSCTILSPSAYFVGVISGNINKLYDGDLNTFTGSPTNHMKWGGDNKTFAQWQALGATFDPNSTGP